MFLCFPTASFAQRPVQAAGRFSEQAGKYVKAHVWERCYVHFDRASYALGDTVYFKAYVTAGEKHVLSTLSSVLHVELIDGAREIRRSLLLQLNSGVAWGDMALPDSLPGGVYQIRVYTRWMRNAGDSAIFSRSFQLGSATGTGKYGQHRAALGKSMANAPAIVFFPEGGSLVTGIASRIAFIATDSQGLGLPVKGIIVNAKNEVVDSLTTQHLGMGSFRLTPKKNEIYRAKVVYRAGSQELLLPKAVEDGITLSVTNDQLSKASVKIEASRSFYKAHKDKDFYLLVLSGEKLVTVTFKLDNEIKTMDLAKASLSTGIVRVTLISSDAEPVCERLFFVKNADQTRLTLTPDKPNYATREKVSMKLHVSDRLDSPSRGHYSVSVTNESKVSVNENAERTLLTELLLTADLQGYVEEPNYYFATSSARVRSELDLVMLTHGYRQFAWKEVMQESDKPAEYLPETGLEIEGMASTLKGKPIAEGTVSLFTPQGGPMFTQRTDKNGVFRFANLSYPDPTRFVINTVIMKGKNKTKLSVNKQETDEPIVLTPVFRLNEKAITNQQGNQAKNDTVLSTRPNQPPRKVILLKEVKIRAQRDDNYRTESLAGAGHADQVMHRKEIQQIGGSLATSLNGRLRGITFLNSPGSGGGVPYLDNLSNMGNIGNTLVVSKSQAPNPQVETQGIPGLKFSRNSMLIVVDGAELPLGSGINSLNLNNIETVEVLKYSNANIYGMDGANGVLVITTRRGRYEPSDTSSVGVLPIVAKGFYKARDFYVPKYDHKQNNTAFWKDRRESIFWKPELITDNEGNTTVEYYTSDTIGRHRIVIEGINDKGALGRTVYQYEVHE